MMAVSFFEKSENFENRLEPAVGYRAWRLAGNRLRSLTAPSIWEPGVTKVAVCGGEEPQTAIWRQRLPPRYPRRRHRSPEPACQCGIYAHHLVADAVRQVSLGPHFCVGAVCCWGRLVIHKEGFRAEYATLIGLCVAPAHLAFRNAIKPIEAIAKQYRVPMLLDPERLVMFASEFGSSYAPAIG